MAKRLLRLGSGGSLRRSSTAEGYPVHIEIRGVVDDRESEVNEFRRRHEKEELKFWKRKATALEEANDALAGTVEALREKVAALERSARLRDLEEDVAAVERSSGSRDSPASSRSSTPVEVDSESDEKFCLQQRRDGIVRQLVEEMERLMVKSSDDGSNGSSPASSDGTQEASGNPMKVDIDTSRLECLVSKILKEEQCDVKKRATAMRAALDALAEAKAKKQIKLQKEEMKMQCRDLYQLTCRNCVGCNYVGSTKKEDLKERVKENYAMVWQLVRTAYGKGDGSEVECDHGPQSLSFRASSFAHHVAEHCRDCNSEEEVYRWCVEHVRAQRISKHPFM